ncbi:MAG TPA: PQQ-dependent sugar dehydrogenase [Patescibacteria group bacterium]|nr:PQQ-dependent sugar dehydrogenase [Patescibacteria group bacterium]
MFKKLFVLVYLVFLSLLFVPKVQAALPTGFQKSTVVSGLNFPDALGQSPDGRIFILQKTGEVKIYKNGTLAATPAITLPVDANGEHGLLGIAFDPSFASNNYVYLAYVNASPNEFRVSRFTVTGDTINAGSEKILLKSTQTLNTYHISGTLRFGPDGKLWVSVGNNANNANSQDLSNIQGKLLRINSDGSIPTDNPFYGLAGGQASIWAYGFRNPFRFNFLPDGRPIVGDVGEATTEEVNIIQKGGDYGWPDCEGPCTPPNGKYIDPLFTYQHNGGSAAVVGGYVNSSTSLGSSMQGVYFYGDYAKGFIRYLKIDSEGDFISDNAFDDAAGEVVDLMNGPDGNMYFVTVADSTFSSNTGSMYKITYNATNLPPVAAITANPIAGLAPLKVTFSSAGSSDPLGGNLTYSWDFGDGSKLTSANPTHTYQNNGTYTVVLTVSNAKGKTNASTKITVGKTLPVPKIDTPIDGTHYNAGDTISFSGEANDAQDGDLPASDFTWSVIFHHQTHIHPFIDQIQGVKNGTFVIPNTGEPSAETSYEIILTVVDSSGLSATTSRIISPNTVNLTFDSYPVSGLTFMLDGIPHSTPYNVESVVGFIHGLDTPNLQTLNGFNYNFNAWSDKLAQSHNFTTPATSSAYLVSFTETPTGNGSIHFRVRDIDKNGNPTGKFVNDATAVLTDTTGTVAFQTTTSKTVNGQDGWVFFDNVPSGQYGALTYKGNSIGAWKQTTCDGAGTTQSANIKNQNTNNFTAAWQNNLKVMPNQITWCSDEGLQTVTSGNLAMRVDLIENDPNVPKSYLATDHVNGATVKLTDPTGSTVIQSTTTQASNGQDGWAFFQNIPAGNYGLMAYKAGFEGFWKMTSCAGASDPNASIQNSQTENNKAAWNNSVVIVAGVTNYCYDLGFHGNGGVHYRVKEFDSSGNWTGKYINGATAKLTDTTGNTVLQTTTSKTVNGEDGWVFFDNVQAGYYGAATYLKGYTGYWRQTDCNNSGTTNSVTIQNDNTENQTAAWQSNLHIPGGDILWCSDVGLKNPNTQAAGGIHFRVREIGSNGSPDGKYVNGATAKLTDTTGNTVIQTATSKTVGTDDGWVFFDQIPAGNYGILVYENGLTGGWKQTDCGTGSTTTGASIKNSNTEGQTASWQNDITISAGKITWCSDQGLLLPATTPVATPIPSQAPAMSQSVVNTPTQSPTSTPTPTQKITPTPTLAPTSIPTPTISGQAQAPTPAATPTMASTETPVVTPTTEKK